MDVDGAASAASVTRRSMKKHHKEFGVLRSGGHGW